MESYLSSIAVKNSGLRAVDFRLWAKHTSWVGVPCANNSCGLEGVSFEYSGIEIYDDTLDKIRLFAGVASPQIPRSNLQVTHAWALVSSHSSPYEPNAAVHRPLGEATG